MKQRIKRALSRARYAAMGAAIGAFVGGLFSRSTASTGAATGALVGAIIGEKRHSAGGIIEEVRGRREGADGEGGGLSRQLSELREKRARADD
ncbi:hypothetical protein BRC65_00510 [Halobacteriales archaeon QH_2_65_14]|nr:MAG: hypothetical protein BRC65_00510 [Halobacteriales archaeon QH_2_65_14]